MPAHGEPVTRSSCSGSVLILWALFIVVTAKYVLAAAARRQ
jgi:K+ transporter